MFTRADFYELEKTFIEAQRQMKQDRFDRAVKFVDDHNNGNRKFFFNLCEYDKFTDKPKGVDDVTAWRTRNIKLICELNREYFVADSIVYRHSYAMGLMKQFLEIMNAPDVNKPATFSMNAEDYAVILSWAK